MRVGIWGAGFMGGKHAAAIAAEARASLVAVCDLQQEAAERILSEHGAADGRWYDDIDELLRDDRIDALVIATPPGARGDVAQRAAAAGIHLFIEKPIALDQETVEAIAAAVDQAGVCCQVGHHFRCHPAVQWLKAAIADGSAGRCCQFQSRFWMNGTMSAWWKDPAGSGGQVVEQLIHCYDMALHLFGSVDRVCGLRATLCKGDDPSYRVDDNSVGLLHFANGALATVSGSNTAVPDRFMGDWRVVCEHLTADFTTDGDWRTPEQATVQRVADGGAISDTIPVVADLHGLIAADWLRACLDGGTPVSPISDAVATHRAVFRMVESMQADGAWMDLSAQCTGVVA